MSIIHVNTQTHMAWRQTTRGDIVRLVFVTISFGQFPNVFLALMLNIGLNRASQKAVSSKLE